MTDNRDTSGSEGKSVVLGTFGNGRPWNLLGLVLAVVGIVSVIGAVVFLVGGGDTETAGRAGGIDDKVVRDGDRVTAVALLRQLPGDEIRMCQTGLRKDVPGSAPSCDGGTIEVDEDALPDGVIWTTAEGVRFTEEGYRLTGVWRGGRVEQQSLQRVSPQPHSTEYDKPGAGDRFDLPCDVPTTWPDRGFMSEDFQAAESRLQAEVNRHPERYSGFWVAYPRQASTIGPDFGPHVAVVGTVGDPAADQRSLAELYPYSLCVHRVPYSAAQLEAVAKRIKTDETWRISVAPDLGKLQVELFVLDEAARAAIGDDVDKLILRPFVRKA